MGTTKFRNLWVTSVGMRNSDGAGYLHDAILLVSEAWTKMIGPSRTALLPLLPILCFGNPQTMPGEFGIPQ